MHLVHLIGEPGVGKTTTMAALTAGVAPLVTFTRPGRTVFGDRRTGIVAAVELGTRRPGGFSGTDALPMDAITAAEAWLLSGQARSEAPVVLAEGARLANTRFLTAAVRAGWDTHLVLLADDRLAAQRRASRGSTQNPSWVRGAATRATRLADNPPPGVTVSRLSPGGDPAQVAADIAARTGIPFALNRATSPA